PRCGAAVRPAAVGSGDTHREVRWVPPGLAYCFRGGGGGPEMVGETGLGGPRPGFRRGAGGMFSFAVTARGERHAPRMAGVGGGNERLAAALTFDEILAGLSEVGWYEPVADANLEYTLGALHKYGLVERTQNHSAHYASADEYERRNLHYSLSRKGEAAFE